MKTLLLCALLLSGCSIISLPTYNETEYANLIDIAVVASKGTCLPEQTEKLVGLSTHAVLYSKYLPNNELMAEGTALLDESIQALSARATISPAYCNLKLRVIRVEATTLAEAAGGKTK